MRKKNNPQLEDEDASARAERHLAEVAAIISALPLEELTVVQLMLATRDPLSNSDHRFVRMKKLKETPPAQRSELIAAWKEELQQNLRQQ